MAVAGQPAEDVFRGRAQAIVRRNAQFDERDETPVRAAPLLVRVHAEAAVAFLAAQKSAHEGAGEDLVAIRRHVLAENVAPRQESDRRLPRAKEEVDRRLSRHDRHDEMFTGATTVGQPRCDYLECLAARPGSAHGRSGVASAALTRFVVDCETLLRIAAAEVDVAARAP